MKAGALHKRDFVFVLSHERLQEIYRLLHVKSLISFL